MIVTNINFSCTQCGKCCKKTPHVNLYDMLELSDCFVWQTNHNSFISYADNPMDKKQALHFQKFGHTIMVPELDSSLFYYIDFSAIFLPSEEYCSQLENSICKIYGRRPTRCKLSPLNPLIEETEQLKSIQIYKDNVSKNRWKCNFEEGQLIYRDNSIANNFHENLYYQELLNIRDFTDKYLEHLTLQGDSVKNEHLKKIYTATTKKETIVSDILFAIHTALSNGMISISYANKIISNQLNLINNGLEIMNSQKNKIDLQTNREYKNLKIHYENILKNNVFSYNDGLNII